jgi:hypothetical protein
MSETGLWNRVLDKQGRINPTMWARAENDHEIVGTCRVPRCAGYLFVDTPPRCANEGQQPIPWYFARCSECNTEVVSPGGRTLRTKRNGGKT